MGLLDNAITVEEFQKRKKESLAKSRFKETGSVMASPIGEEWQPDNVRPGGHALEAPMFSPDDLIGSGIFSKLGLLATHAAPALASGLLGVVAKNKGVSTMPSKLAQALNKQAGAIAWHGSPHKFDKFDMSKIGTGEGAQAYGHGLYMAESPEVAKSYSKLNPTVNAPPNRLFMGQELTPGTPEYHAGTLLENSTLAKARKDVASWISEGSPDTKMVDGWKKTLDTLNKATKKSDFKVAKNENLYKTDIPDEAIARFLDWDKPLSQQAPEVLDSLKSIKDKFGKEWTSELLSGGGTKSITMDSYPGSSAIMDLRSALGVHGPAMPEVTESLKQAGIPGIRYLDSGSRGTGTGTSNYVLFDDQLPRILERNGQPTGLQPWAKGEWKGLLDEPAPKLTEFEQRHLTAQKNAALPVEQGGLGLPEGNTAMDRARALGYSEDASYRGMHTAPMADSGAPMHDLTGAGTVYPDDVYSSMAARYYGAGEPTDAALFSKLQSMRGKPEESVRIFRAVPKDSPGVAFHHGDWVTPNRNYAVEHGEGALGGDYKILATNKPAKTLFTNGDSPYEFGFDRSQYFAEGPASIPLMTSKVADVQDRSRFAAFDPKLKYDTDLLGYADPYLLGAMGAGGLLGMGGYSMMNDK